MFNDDLWWLINKSKMFAMENVRFENAHECLIKILVR